jgi:hypothetical protein
MILKEWRIWEVKWGRVITDTVLVAANTFDDAVSTAVEFIRAQQPKWDAGRDDILTLRQTGNSIFLLE